MLSHFPQVRDEESTYSIFSRLQFALQPPDLQIMGSILFNKTFEVGRLNFQGSFDYLCSNLPSKFTTDYFLHNNTIFPLFIPFLSIEKQEKAVKYFKGDYPNRINECLQIGDIVKNRTYIRICKECIKEDLNIYGEPYYRRQHEIELYRVCYKHKTPLYEYTIFPYILPRRYEDFYTVLSNSKEIAIPKEFYERFLDIATDINTIFTANLEDWNIKITKDKILNRLKENGYLTVTDIKLQKKLNQDFKEYYTEEFLDYIGYNFDINSNYSWLSIITRNKPLGDPLKYILAIRFLFGSFKEFYQYNKEYSAFKKGPYPCLNTICPNYNKLVIKDILQIKNIGHPIATFKCEHCGFQYNRRGPDKNDNDIYIKTYVMEYGHLWHAKLKECVDKGLSITQMTKILGYKNFQMLKTMVNKYKNSQLDKTSVKELTDESNNLLLEKYKHKILSFINENPSANRITIYRLNQNAYKYLLKTDNKWLSNTLRIEKKSEPISNEQRYKNYWLNKDKFLVKELLRAVDRIKAEKAPYRRITIDILKKYTCYFGFYENKTKLPKCFQVLDKVCETIPDYQKRRINYVVNKMANNNTKITISKVLHSAGLPSQNVVSQEILDYISEIIKDHN